MGTASLGGIRPGWRRSQLSRYARNGLVGLVVVEVVYSRIPKGGGVQPQCWHAGGHLKRSRDEARDHSGGTLVCVEHRAGTLQEPRFAPPEKSKGRKGWVGGKIGGGEAIRKVGSIERPQSDTNGRGESEVTVPSTS